MKLFYKFINCLCILVLSFIVICPPVYGQTLRELEQELANKQNELSDNKAKKKLTQDEMAAINSKINSIQKNIEQIQIDAINLQSEIDDLNQQIALKTEQIKSIISYFQISSGESAYLEYVMGAEDFTDFIYRTAVTEQMSSYNDELISSYTATIKLNEEKKIELANKKTELNNQRIAMNEEYKKLGEELVSYNEEEVIITDEVKSLQELVQIYKNKGCKPDDNISTCGKNVLPSTTSFYRQLVSGYVTSWYGLRDCSDPRVSCGHNGIDLSTYDKNNVPVYAIGTGMVAAITYKSSCGGNMVFIHHRLTNGQTYTSVYMHLYQVWVSKGDTVTKDTVIGIMGGGSTTPWDYCSTGPHSHLGIATGLYGVDYNSGSLKSHYINPKAVVNFPNSLYTPFYDRFTAF